MFGLAQTHHAYSLTLSFTQSGFSDDSTVSGSFTGFDSNNDGWISSDEVTEATTTFVGGSFFLHDFTVTFPQPFTVASHLFNINYDLDGTIGNDPGEFIVAINSLIFHIDLWGAVNYETSSFILPLSTETFACVLTFVVKQTSFHSMLQALS